MTGTRGFNSWLIEVNEALVLPVPRVEQRDFERVGGGEGGVKMTTAKSSSKGLLMFHVFLMFPRKLTKLLFMYVIITVRT
jgi:hypothetical protein